MAAERSCPCCEAPLDPGALEGLCAKCLARELAGNPALEGVAPDIGLGLHHAPVIEGPGSIIGRYKLLQRLGEGGFGVVFMAEQREPIVRRVALKVIKQGMDTRQVIARFEAERQALAMMDHPAIAKVLDAGATASGRPYFAMELVRGLPITRFCDDQGYDLRQRLELFSEVCSAVQHAHQKGIIHRDLKPSNILVGLDGNRPIPKVIDFGIAKATQQQLTDKTLFTRIEQFLGTPLYVSPEQVGVHAVDIDTRSDIYSLGVVLYELLTGKPPLDAEEILASGFDEMRRMIREKEAPKPSTRLNTLEADRLEQVAKYRGVEPVRLGALLRGDLDWIVLKSIEKDRTRRYETANALAADIKRYLSHEPVTATPPSALYKFRKFARRNQGRLAAIAAVALALVAGTVVSISQAVRANRALAELRASAPAFVSEARGLAARERFDEAIAKLDYAIKLRPDLPEYLVAKGDLLQCQFKLADAAAVYRAALRVQPGVRRAEDSAELCEELLAAPRTGQGKLTRESLAKLHAAMQRQQRPAAELMAVARLLGEEKKLLSDYWLERLKDLPISGAKPLEKRLTVREDGLLALDLGGMMAFDLSLVADAPLASLDLSGCSELTDISPLRGLHLETLDISGTQVADLGPLREMHTLKKLHLRQGKATGLGPLGSLRLEVLDLNGTRVSDLSPLRDMKLREIRLNNTRVVDVSPLAGMPLEHFSASNTSIVDFAPLSGAPLEKCILINTPVGDLSFLRDSPLKELTLFDCEGARGYSLLPGLTGLEILSLPRSFRNLPEDELAAIGGLRTHPNLRIIETEYRVRDGVEVWSNRQSKDLFWQKWDREQAVVTLLRQGGFQFELTPLADGAFRFSLSNQKSFTDLSVLKDFPVTELIVPGTGVTDLRPLANLPITLLDLRTTAVTDLSPLESPALRESLRSLYLWRTPVKDFQPVAACTKLELFDVSDTAFADLAIVRDLKLRVLRVANTQVTGLSPLAGAPLVRLEFSRTAVTDITPLLQCRELESIVLPESAHDVEALWSLPKLKRISYQHHGEDNPLQSSGEFFLESAPGGITPERVSKVAERFARDATDSMFGLKMGFLQVWFGLDDEHSAACRQVVEAAEQTADDGYVKERAAKAWCLRASDDVAMRQRVLALAREAARTELEVGHRPWYQQTLGMAEFRAGNDTEAEAAFLEAERAADAANWNPELRPFIVGPSCFYRAMIAFRRGKRDEAAALYEQGKALVPPVPENAAQVLTPEVTHLVLSWLACREAGSLLTGSAASER